jgi:hemerythrin-like metal-binding protein
MPAPDTYSVGVTSIDEQHQALLAMLNAFKFAITSHQSKKEVRAIVDPALDAVRAHFAHEEALCNRCGYPEASEHHFKHEQILLNVTSLTDDALTGKNPPEVLSEHLEVLREMFLAHIAQDDRRLAMHLHTHGIH